VKVFEDCVCVVRETHGEPTLPLWISSTTYCTASIPTLTDNSETKGTDPTKSTRGCYTDGFAARSNIAKLKNLGLKDLSKGSCYLSHMAHEPLQSDKVSVRAGAGAIQFQDADCGAADLV
jgi:hypothetical protein